VVLLLVAGLPGYAPASAASLSATGVALSGYSDCDSPAGLDISMVTDASPTRETGKVTTSEGDVLMTFDQATGFQNYNGTFSGYNFSSPPWSVPAGTIVGLYASIGDPSPAPDNTIEWFVSYVCDTGVVVDSCFGDYGTCPQSAETVQPNPPADRPGPDMVPIPSTAVVGAFVVTTPIYFAPQADAGTATVMEAGKTVWVFGVDASGQFYKVMLAGKFFWVPVSSMGPNYDNVWRGKPLPTDVVS
jgi:hypothetical protein